MERYAITDLIKIGLRRFFWVFIPFVLLLTIGLMVLNFFPARYHSKALLVVQDQQVSEDLVPSAIRARAEDRLETIKAELRSRNYIVDLSNKFGLIDRKSDEPFSRKVGRVKDDIRISIERINGGRGGRNEPSTITFQIGFVHENPQTALRVANQLVTDFQEENVEARLDAAESTADFFREEERKLRRQLTDVRRRIAAVREANPGMTPDSADFNRGVVSRLSNDIERAEFRVKQINQNLSILRMQQPIIIDANERNDAERVALRERRRQLEGLRRRFTENHPDVIAMNQEVLALEARLDPAAFRRRADETLTSIERQLQNGQPLGERESNELRERRADIQAMIDGNRGAAGEQSLARLQFETQERSYLDELASEELRLTDLREQLAAAEARLEQMPAIAAQVNALESEEDRLLGLLSRIQSDRTRIERTESLEAQQKAERIYVLEQPVLPDVPTAPDKPRIAILIAGAAGGISAALGLGPIFLFPRVDTRRQLAQSLPGVPVVEVPEIRDEEEERFRKAVFVGLIAASVVLTALLAFVALKVLL